MQYIIYNKQDKQHYVIYFVNASRCYNWIVNTLDLSKNWSFEPYDDTKFLGSENYNFNINTKEGSK
mgnify:CR=1 FL=1